MTYTPPCRLARSYFGCFFAAFDISTCRAGVRIVFTAAIGAHPWPLSSFYTTLGAILSLRIYSPTIIAFMLKLMGSAVFTNNCVVRILCPTVTANFHIGTFDIYSNESNGTIALNRDVEVMLHLFSAERQKSLGTIRDKSRCSNISRVNFTE